MVVLLLHVAGLHLACLEKENLPCIVKLRSSRAALQPVGRRAPQQGMLFHKFVSHSPPEIGKETGTRIDVSYSCRANLKAAPNEPLRRPEADGLVADDMPSRCHKLIGQLPTEAASILLRRAHLNEAPDEPHRRLAADGLVTEDMLFEDPFVALRGPALWRDYMMQLRGAGI